MTTVIANSSSTRKALDKALRSGLERTVVKARDIAEEAAAQALKRHAVGDKQAPDYFTEEQRALRNRLRAHGRQLGDVRHDNGEQTIHKLVTEVAYEHWHRMLFARFLEQNGLLMYDQHTSVTLQDCNELIEESVFQDELEQACSNGWELAGVLASKMLPQIFRTDSPVFQLQFALELQRELEALVMGLAPEVFQAQDSLGWVYQFWQSKRKEEVNRSEVKIGADELSPVTQLFTEPYMVSFLLDNSLGAWWAGKRLSDQDWIEAESEQELRDKAAIAGVPLEYLRFTKEDDRWQPASGFFEGWPSQLSELKTLDPCCGSGHFLVAAFLMLVPMRMELEGLSAKEAIDRVLEENLHGLELDQRCVELAAFAVALEAWRYPNAGGYRALPELHLACSGLSISAAKDELKSNNYLTKLFSYFEYAPILGSLIDIPSDLVRLLSLGSNNNETQSTSEESKVTAFGVTKSAEILSGEFSLIATNVPYLGMSKYSSELSDFIAQNYPHAKQDLAIVFLERIKNLLSENGVYSLVTLGEWLYLGPYTEYRKKYLNSHRPILVQRLGWNAFSTPIRANPALLIGCKKSHHNDRFSFLDGSSSKNIQDNVNSTIESEVQRLDLDTIQLNPDLRFIKPNSGGNEITLLNNKADARSGLHAGDLRQFFLLFWEVGNFNSIWEPVQTAVSSIAKFSGKEQIIRWEKEKGRLAELAERVKHLNHAAQNWRAGKPFWGKTGIVVGLMGRAACALYSGQRYDVNSSVMVPKNTNDLTALWCFCESGEFSRQVRELDNSLKLAPRTLLKVRFNEEKWKETAREEYPNGLPLPFSDDPTQWIFHGHPCGSVVWDEEQKWTVESDLRVDDRVLQVAVARLLGYQWPAELDAEMELADEQRAWVERCKALAPFVDDDGIVCLPAVRGEKAAELRLEAMLEAAYGDAWTTNLRNQLLDTVGSKSLSAWLRDKFFEQHCKLFQHRPFIWQIWDGLKDGFSVLVNYHKLDKAGLERLIYTYLGDWIRTQQAEVANGVDGADIRLAAAQTLKQELENILAGEKPYDIFVRWKPLEEQPIGWNPDLNDGVRLNIRPFMLAKDMGKKGAGVLRAKPNIHWKKDRGTDVESAPWYHLGPEYGDKLGARINEHHLDLDTKHRAKESEK
ncbi:Eco57I restriction-modification methylase domain-containing protein [Pseudidiomarina sp. YC-516-91]|uniref:Eco57I restriction-modification methylase domain-containing protein n=1 Tax=Pseudidiomarina salilacus TaxID=3384452 RepID=UPI0039851E89